LYDEDALGDNPDDFVIKEKVLAAEPSEGEVVFKKRKINNQARKKK
jgi:hypothetical protein